MLKAPSREELKMEIAKLKKILLEHQDTHSSTSQASKSTHSQASVQHSQRSFNEDKRTEADAEGMNEHLIEEIQAQKLQNEELFLNLKAVQNMSEK